MRAKMNTEPVVLFVRIDPAIKEELITSAKTERRSVNRQLEVILQKHFKAEQVA